VAVLLVARISARQCHSFLRSRNRVRIGLRIGLGCADLVEMVRNSPHRPCFSTVWLARIRAERTFVISNSAVICVWEANSQLVKGRACRKALRPLLARNTNPIKRRIVSSKGKMCIHVGAQISLEVIAHTLPPHSLTQQPLSHLPSPSLEVPKLSRQLGVGPGLR
jgi:hypothetical protein